MSEAEREAEREAGRVRATAWEVIAAANRPPADGPLQGRVARLEARLRERDAEVARLAGGLRAAQSRWHLAHVAMVQRSRVRQARSAARRALDRWHGFSRGGAAAARRLPAASARQPNAARLRRAAFGAWRARAAAKRAVVRLLGRALGRMRHLAVAAAVSRWRSTTTDAGRRRALIAVSYTHLTLPTILLV